MFKIVEIRSLLKQFAQSSNSKNRFYKTEAGGYAQHDQFIGVKGPVLRRVAKDFYSLTLGEMQCLIESKINEERVLALFILISQYQKAEIHEKNLLYQFYLYNLKHVNNWNLVDISAHKIIGAHLLNSEKDVLINLAKSDNMWERRISIVATWYFICNNDLDWTFAIASLLLADKQDLIHKAVGWMLREAGKRNKDCLITFLNKHAKNMPRTMLRYSIKKFPEQERKNYLIYAHI